MIVEMKKLVLVGHRSDRHKLFKALHKSRLVEIVSAEEFPYTEKLNNAARVEEYREKMGRLDAVFAFLKEAGRVADISCESLASRKGVWQPAPSGQGRG